MPSSPMPKRGSTRQPLATPTPPKRASPRVPLEDFIDKGRVLKCVSSNVRSASYDEEEEMLLITYKSGASYGYLRISEMMARSYYFAPSKGKWCWSNLRVRGSATAHQVPYFKMD